jgi:CDP-glucose 4,6-dehydratase
MGKIVRMVNRRFWNGKRVFVTGHTGFKGGWMATWLSDMGARVAGYGLKPDTDPSYFTTCRLDRYLQSTIGDVRDKDEVRRAMQAQEPDVVFHMAAQALVRRSYREPVETFATNLMGTVHILDAVRHVPSVRVVIVVTSDKCYENREWLWGYRESEPMGGYDPYSASKACAELATSAYRRSYFDTSDRPLGVATVRAGNVIGGGDWAVDRLVPDAVRALRQGEPLILRNPGSVRPWQHVLEPLAGYLMLAEHLWSEGKQWAEAWNFGPQDEDAVSVAFLADLIIRTWGEGTWRAGPGQQSLHEGRYLKLDCTKAKQMLGWRPRLTLEEAVAMTTEWYRKALYSGSTTDLGAFTIEQIQSYEARLEG